MTDPPPMSAAPMRTLQCSLFALGLAGFGINLALLVRRLGDGSATLAGCGAGSGCEAVLGSQWSQLFGVPVTVPGLLVYAMLMLALTRAGRPLLPALLGMIGAAVVWFLAVQAFLIRAFCPWCLAAHAVGVLVVAGGLAFAVRTGMRRLKVAKTFSAVTVASVIALALSQTFGPRPATHRFTEFGAADSGSRLDHDAHSTGEGRLIRFFDGTKGYRAEQLPHLGRADATHVLVEYFDYTCPACRTMGRYLDALVAAHPDQICAILLPVPMDRNCNPLMPARETGNPGACTMARAALAIWRNSPENFHAFHQALLSDPTEANASMLAAALIADPAAAMSSSWVQTIIETNIRDWQTLSADNPKLPKLVVEGRTVMHGLPPTEDEFIRIVAGRLGLE